MLDVKNNNLSHKPNSKIKIPIFFPFCLFCFHSIHLFFSFLWIFVQSKINVKEQINTGKRIPVGHYINISQSIITGQYTDPFLPKFFSDMNMHSADYDFAHNTLDLFYKI